MRRLRRYEISSFKSSVSDLGARGFTLIEVLIASALLSIILAVLYSTFFISHKAVSGFDESILRLQECRAALDTLKREIDSSFYRENDKKTVFKLEDRDIFGKQTSRIIFTTLSPLNNGVSEIKYHVEKSGDKLIFHKEVSNPFSLNNGYREADIIEGILEFTIEAKYNDKWVRTWDTEVTNGLPAEVRISLRVKIKDRDILLSERAKPMMT